MRFELEPITMHAGRWVFDWDPAAGTVAGPAAADIERIASFESVPLHPRPASHVLSQDPLRSWQDMAAICGIDHRLPPELAEHYPAVEFVEGPEGLVY